MTYPVCPRVSVESLQPEKEMSRVRLTTIGRPRSETVVSPAVAAAGAAT